MTSESFQNCMLNQAYRSTSDLNSHKAQDMMETHFRDLAIIPKSVPKPFPKDEYVFSQNLFG